MNLEQAINEAYLAATGMIKTLTPTDKNYLKLKSFANRFSHVWANEPLGSGTERWESLEAVASLGALEAGVAEYRLPSRYQQVAFKAVSDPAGFLVKPDGEKVALKGMDRGRFMGAGSHELVFSFDSKTRNIELKPEVVKDYAGAELRVICYRDLELLENGDDEIEVDNPYWLVHMMAAEYIRPDIVMKSEYGNLIAIANNEMTTMKNDHRTKRIMSMKLR